MVLTDNNCSSQLQVFTDNTYKVHTWVITDNNSRIQLQVFTDKIHIGSYTIITWHTHGSVLMTITDDCDYLTDNNYRVHLTRGSWIQRSNAGGSVEQKNYYWTQVLTLTVLLSFQCKSFSFKKLWAQLQAESPH